MTKLLEQAIARVRELPDEDQDALALVLISMADADSPLAELDERTRGAIREGLEQARRGEFASDAEIEALWKSHGV